MGQEVTAEQEQVTDTSDKFRIYVLHPKIFENLLVILVGVDGGESRLQVARRCNNMGINTYLIPEPMGTCVEMLWFWSQNPWEINSFLAFALSRVVGKG